MKKILIFIFVLVLAGLLFVCVNTGRQKDDVVSFASWGSQSELNILKGVLADFENQSGLKVDFIHIPQNYFQKLHLLYASNLEPDVVFINNQYIQMYIAAGLLENLNTYFSGNEIESFYKEALDCFKNGNDLYAIPRDISNLVLYVNKDILKKSGIKYKEKIETLDELKSIVLQLKNNEHFSINNEDKSLYWLYFLTANGGGVLSDDKKEVIIRKKESISALDLYSDLINKYNAAPTKAQIGSMTTAQMFINGKLAMYLGGRWMIPKFREAIDFDWDIVEFPSSQDNKVYVDASGWAVSKKSKHKEQAIKLIKYLSSDEVSEKFTADGLIVPARRIVAEKYIVNDKSQKPKHSYIFIKMLDNAKPTPVNENYNKINDIINEKAKEMFSSKQKADEVFDEKTAEKIESLL